MVCTLFAAVALTVSQLQPARQAAAASAAGRASEAWESLSGGFAQDFERLHLVDLAGGSTTTADVPRGERWNFVSASPRRDEEGRAEAVGRFARRWKNGDDPHLSACGLVRIRLPEAEVVERVGLDVLMIGPPAWNPDGDGQLLIPAGNGRLYSYRFGPRDDAEGGVLAVAETHAEVGAGLTPLEWECEAPGRDEPYLADPIWPTAPEFRNLVIVSLSAMTEGPGDGLRYGLPAFWWLKLNEDGERIVDAGPLIDPDDEPAAPGVFYRFPSELPGAGRPRLAYILAAAGAPEGDLRIGALELRPGGGLRLRPATESSHRGVPIGRLHPSRDGSRVYGFDGRFNRMISVSLAPEADPAPLP